jgi:anhydro-N-acetylmuramic acid kinase
MIVAGVMSGTSADGVDVALCRIGPGAGKGDPPRIKLIGHLGTAYPKAVRAAALRVMEGEALPAAEMSRLNWRLGGIYADCVEKTAAKFGVRVQLVGCHGQTVHHEASGAFYLGRRVRSTWQMGEAAVIAERLRCPVVSDFRPADLAAGGQGAPLVPMLDWSMFRSATVNRVLLNLGGIANVTVIPAGCALEDVLAFDTGPGNMVMDAIVQKEFGKPFDRGGEITGRGKMGGPLVDQMMRNPYFKRKPPKSCGREEFGAEFAGRLAELCRKDGGCAEDAVTAAMVLTVTSIGNAYLRFCQERLKPGPVEVIAAGGGVKNKVLMSFLRLFFKVRGARLLTTDAVGIPTQAKEGVAFALLAWLTWNGLAGNVLAATGAKRAVVLGKVSHGG